MAVARLPLPSSAFSEGASNSMVDAVNKVMIWTKTVVEGLQKIEWQVSSEDTDLYSIRNPNPTIHQLLTQYDDLLCDMRTSD